MERRRNLTNEIVTKKFQNQFDLVNYAISVATNIIRTGREAHDSYGSENPALQALDEIATGRDKYEEVEEEIEIEVIEEEVVPKKRSKKSEKALTE